MKRDIMIDVLKGMGIATVVIGHIEGFWFTIMPVYSFHMPLFFFISGFLFSLTNESFIEMDKKKLVKKNR